MYPATVIKVEDQSQYQTTNILGRISTPIFMTGFASDRGTEEVGLWAGTSWYAMYGYTTSFSKYGQALKQAANVIDNGGSLYCKRVVAPDSQLANLAVYVTIQTFPATEAIVDEETGEVTTPASEARVVLKYNSVSVVCKSNDMDTLANYIEGAIPASDPDSNTIVLPLFVMASLGRGSWAPRFRITPDYRFGRSLGYAKYMMEIISPTAQDKNETIYFSLSNRVEKSSNVSMGMRINEDSNFVKCLVWEDSFDYLRGITELTLGLENGTLEAMDYLFGTDLRGNKLGNIEVDTTDFNLQSIYGNLLLNGSDGSFENGVIGNEDYTNELVKLFNGTYSEDIYNLDSVLLDLIVDANYDDKVKRAIEELITFREDVFFIRDMGLNIENIYDIEAKERNVLHNRYSSSYCNSMDVLDPETRRYIHVTIPYLMIGKLINHFLNGRNRPFAGIRYGIYWMYGNDIRKGSINFLPKVTPGVDEKQDLDDLGVNYVSIYQGYRVVMETLYTSQHVVMQSQLSFSNNVWMIQEVIKALRETCPINRYAIASGEDLSNYQNDLETVLQQYESNFLSFNLEYQADPSYEVQKIYYAVLSVRFKDFFQAEYFRIVALPNF